MEFAVDSMVATVLAGRLLSMPSAAEGGGRSPAFTAAYQPATIGHRDQWLGATDYFSQPPRRNRNQLRAVYARILAAANRYEAYGIRPGGPLSRRGCFRPAQSIGDGFQKIAKPQQAQSNVAVFLRPNDHRRISDFSSGPADRHL
jgi:hypothetical protein